MKPRAFAVFAHPDDIEFVAAGTLLRLQSVGYEIHYMNVADGCCGSTVYGREELARMRRDEAIAACKLIGAEFHESIAHDMDVFYDRATLATLSAVMREVAPQIVLTHAPHDYMEDHMNTCRLAITAAFARGMPNFPTHPPRPAVSEPVTVYHAQPHGNCDPLYNPVRPGLFVDIGDVLEQKTEMLACHASQKLWLDESQGFDSYLHTMREGSREVGRLSGRYEYAEGWRRHLHLGFCAAEADPLAEALPKC
ncbi:MAG TPA: PIG-L deacetylase family protein, partial [Pirellulales bacterium]|nr:PIG-L deacetylase family protein [Pirellulales bacterium]